MQSFKNFVKRNIPVFIFGLAVALVFLLIILTQPKGEKTTPAGFRKVEEEVFEREPTEPTPETKAPEYASQKASPENKGKPYFYGEYDPNLRDNQGYPIPPTVGSTTIPAGSGKEDEMEIRFIEQDNYANRIKTVYINFTKEGFKPADTFGFTGQKIIWTNTSDSDIVIMQTLPIHEALKNGITLKPGESFEFRPLLDKQFTYVEKYSQKYGSIIVNDVTQPLMRLE